MLKWRCGAECWKQINVILKNRSVIPCEVERNGTILRQANRNNLSFFRVSDGAQLISQETVRIAVLIHKKKKSALDAHVFHDDANSNTGETFHFQNIADAFAVFLQCSPSIVL